MADRRATADHSEIAAGVGNRIKEARQNKQLAQEALAKFVDVSRSAVTQWENGLTFPSFEKTIELATVLGVRPEWIAFSVGSEVRTGSAPPLDTVGIDVVAFGETPDHRTVRGRCCLDREYLAAKKIQFTADAAEGVFFYQWNSEAFAPRIPMGSYLLVDEGQKKIAMDGDYLIWNGYTAQLVYLAISFVEAHHVTVCGSQREFETRSNPVVLGINKLNIVGRVRGALT